MLEYKKFLSYVSMDDKNDFNNVGIDSYDCDPLSTKCCGTIYDDIDDNIDISILTSLLSGDEPFELKRNTENFYNLGKPYKPYKPHNNNKADNVVLSGKSQPIPIKNNKGIQQYQEELHFSINNIENDMNYEDELDGIILSSNELRKSYSPTFSDDEDDSTIYGSEILEENMEICCFCGILKCNHKNIRHRFFPCKEKHKCKKCGLFFFQHNHMKNPCFEPYERIKI